MPENTETNSWKSVRDLVKGRRSTRAFLPKSIPLDEVLEILDTAKHAPSGGNVQPWKVHVVLGQTKTHLEEKLTSAFFDKSVKPQDQYHYYPQNWSVPFDARRRKVGEQLYQALGIDKRDLNAMRAQKAQNYRFFGAPVGLLFTIPSTLEQGSWLDMGMYIANVMTLARAKGLDTCPEASFISYHSVVREVLGFSEDELLVCGMALGFADKEHPVNSFCTDRQSLEQFVTVHENPEVREPEEIAAKITRLAHENPEKYAVILDGTPCTRRTFLQDIMMACNGISKKVPKKTRVALQLLNSQRFLQYFVGGIAAGKNLQVFDPAWPAALTQKISVQVRSDLLINSDFLCAQSKNKASDFQNIPNINDPFYTGFTSGSTGQPKGFVRNQRSWIKSFDCDSQEFSLTENDVIGALGQFTHSLPLYAVIRALYEGATAVFYSTFRPDKILRDLKRQHVSVLYAVPTQLQALCSAAGSPQSVPSLRLILSSGAKCSPEIREGLRQVFPEASFVEFYGSSELSYVSVAIENENPPPNSVGRPLKDVSLTILGDKGQELPAGEEGRIFVESPYRFMGYAGEEVAGSDQDDILHRGIFVGDTGFMDKDGFLHLTGRIDRMISSAARNIHPEEIEAQLIHHPSIENIAVFGVEDPKRGQQVTAVVTMLDTNVSKKELILFCRKLMASYVIPKQFYHAGRWPLTASGKTDYIRLQAMVSAGDLDPLP